MQDSAIALLKKHGKSFNFARLFLGKKTGNAAARLYRFCRIIDDIADETLDKTEAKKELEEIKLAIQHNRINHPLVGDFLCLCNEHGIKRLNGIILIEGVSEDLSVQAFQTEQEIIQYAYKVAGVVGLMMAPILGASKEGSLFAIDLGIAMQLTNIARDVMEDAKMGRRYLPGAWMNFISAEQITVNKVEQRRHVQQAIAQLLALAQKYYESGIAGLHYLPQRNRKSIAIAAYLYREIGRKLLQKDCTYWQGRVVVTSRRKASLAGSALWDLSAGNIAKNNAVHKQILHKYLKNIDTFETALTNVE